MNKSLKSKVAAILKTPKHNLQTQKQRNEILIKTHFFFPISRKCLSFLESTAGTGLPGSAMKTND